MTKITNKLRVSLTAMAFIMGIGAALANQYSTLPSGGGDVFSCDKESGPTCRDQIGSGYEYPDGETEVILPDTPYNP